MSSRSKLLTLGTCLMMASACNSEAHPSGIEAGGAGKAGASGSGTARAGTGGGLAGAGPFESTLAECKRTLQQSGCPATYQEAIQPGDCSRSPFSTLLSTCGDRRVVAPEQVGGATQCIYNADGTLVGARSCSKIIGNCHCFYAGELDPGQCHSTGVVTCDSDAGV